MVKPFHMNCPIPTHLKSLEFVYAHARGTNCLKLCGECFQEMEDVLLWCNCCRPWWCKLKPNAYAISSFFRILLSEEKEKTFSLYCHQLPQQDKQDRCAVPSPRGEQGFHKGIKPATTLNTTLFKCLHHSRRRRTVIKYAQLRKQF